MNRIIAMGFGLAASAARGLSIVCMSVADLSTPILEFSAACERAAREWDPRLWDRDHDPRSDNRERRP